MKKFFFEHIKKFDYFDLGNSFALYYLFMFFGLPFVYLLGAKGLHLDSLRENASLTAQVAAILLLGLVSFFAGYRALKLRGSVPLRLGIGKDWREKNIPWVFMVLCLVMLAGKVIMFLNGHYLISSRVFHLEPLFGSINSNGFGQFTGYFAVPGFALIGFAFTRYFHLKRGEDARAKQWKIISWSLFILEVVSGLLTGNRLPVITAIMIYAVVRHYTYKKSWKHFFAVVVFNVLMIMPIGSFFERPGDMLAALKTSKPSQVILDSTIGRFSQNAVISAIIEKTKHYSYGKNLLNFFVSLGPPRFIWKEKPTISFQGNKFGHEYGILTPQDFNTNVGPTMVGDLYMNFGIWGIIGGLFVLGLIFRFLFDLLISFSRGAPGGIMIYAIIWANIMKGMEDDVAPALAGTVKLFLFVYLIHLCCVADWKNVVKKVAEFWRPLVYGVVIWLFIGDVVRKFIPTQPWQLMLVLDMTLLLAYTCFAAYLIRAKNLVRKPSLLTPLVIFGAVFLWSALGPYSAGVKAGLVGFRNYLWFVPLMFLGYEMFDSKGHALKFCRMLSCLAIPLALLAGIQLMFHDTNMSLLNPFGESTRFHSGSVNIALVSSVFGSAQRFGMVAMLLFFLGVATKSPATFFAFAGVLLSGSRSAFVLSIFGGIAFLLFTKKRQAIKMSYGKIILGVLLVVAALWSIPSFRNTVSFQIKEGIPMIGQSRIGIFIGEMKETLGNHLSWFGRGVGTFSQGIEYVGERQALSYEKSLGETGIRNLLLEMGIVGLAAFYWMWGSILWAMWNEIRRAGDEESKTIGYAIIFFVVAALLRFTFMHGQTLNDYAVLVPLWFFIGIFFRMKTYESASYSAHVPPRL